MGPPVVWWGRARRRGGSTGHRQKLGWGLPVAHGEARCTQGRGWACTLTSPSPARRHLLGTERTAPVSRRRRLSPVFTVVLLLTCKYPYEVTRSDPSRLFASPPRGLGWEARDLTWEHDGLQNQAAPTV